MFDNWWKAPASSSCSWILVPGFGGPSPATGFGLFRVRHPFRACCHSFVSCSALGTQHSTCRVGDLPGVEGCPLLALFVICILIQSTQRGPFSIPSTFGGCIFLWLFSPEMVLCVGSGHLEISGSFAWEQTTKGEPTVPADLLGSSTEKAGSPGASWPLWFPTRAELLLPPGEKPELFHLWVSGGLEWDTKAFVPSFIHSCVVLQNYVPFEFSRVLGNVAFNSFCSSRKHILPTERFHCMLIGLQSMLETQVSCQ